MRGVIVVGRWSLVVGEKRKPGTVESRSAHPSNIAKGAAASVGRSGRVGQPQPQWGNSEGWASPGGQGESVVGLWSSVVGKGASWVVAGLRCGSFVFGRWEELSS